jgi:hypothetical protein
MIKCLTALAFILSISLAVCGQEDKTFLMVENTISSLLNVEAIRDISSQRGVIVMQLKDVNQLVSNNKITPQQYQQLKNAYNDIERNCNQFADQITTDIISYSKLKKMDNSETFIQTLGKKYEVNLDSAKDAYDNRFASVYNNVIVQNGQSKGIFILVIPLIKIIAPQIISIADQLLNKKKGSDEIVFNLAAPLLKKRISNILKYPDWENYVTSAPQINAGAAQTGNKPPSQNTDTTVGTSSKKTPLTDTGNNVSSQGSFNFPIVNANIAFSDAKDNVISFGKPKNITSGYVDDSTANKSIPIFYTAGNLKNGSSFNIKITGFTYYAVLAFNYDNHNWDLLESVSGKNIKEGYDEPSLNQSIILPPTPADQAAQGKKRRFIISGNEPTEHFLVLLSNKKIELERLNNLLKSSLINEAKFDEIKTVFGANMVKSPVLVPIAGASQLTEISIKNEATSDQVIVPLYFKLMKG